MCFSHICLLQVLDGFYSQYIVLCLKIVTLLHLKTNFVLYCSCLLVLCISQMGISKMDYIHFHLTAGKGIMRDALDVGKGKADQVLGMSHPAFVERWFCDAPSPTFSVSSLDLLCCVVMCNSFLLGLSFMILNVLLSELGYVVCGGLEKHSKHKINVSKHFNNVGEKYVFIGFFSDSCDPGWPRVTEGMIDPLAPSG